MRDAPFAPGEVWLVGAGPGDPDLLTLKALRLIGEADVVFHDALVGAGVLALIPAATRRVAVGKRAGRHATPQSLTNRMLADAARAQLRVVRLKGGDPGIFGRAAEEIDHLAQCGIRVRVCPGVTTASAAAAAAGLSLTLRGQARSLSFVTLQGCDTGALELDWAALAAARGSLAVYMGRAAAPHLVRRLIGAGRAGDTPVLIATHVSLPGEQRIHTRLDALELALMLTDRDAPTLLLIGEAFAAPAAADAALAATQSA